MSTPSANVNSWSWRDRVVIARFEIMAAAMVVADILARRDATEADFDRLVLCLQRLRALQEVPT
ncbi:MAG: hypothetical protein ABL964_01135 [Steroidobacteraceae bacterium]